MKALVAVTIFVEVDVPEGKCKKDLKVAAAKAVTIDTYAGNNKEDSFTAKANKKAKHCEVLFPGEWHMLYGRIPMLSK